MTSCLRGGPGPSGIPLAGIQRWWILIGHSDALGTVDWMRTATGTELVVLNDDPRIRLGTFPYGTLRLAYLSVGEADMQRPFWGEIRDRSFVIEPNPDWPDIARVDIRDKRWQELLLSDEAPRLIRTGFHGFMLDTIDTPVYLERREPVRFAGTIKALREWVSLLRAAYPRAVILANGFAGLPEVAPWVDGFVSEGVFATWDFVTRAYRRTTEHEREWRLAQIERARDIADRPVFAVEYADAPDGELGRWARTEARRHGFKPYVTVRDINRIPPELEQP